MVRVCSRSLALSPPYFHSVEAGNRVSKTSTLSVSSAYRVCDETIDSDYRMDWIGGFGDLGSSWCHGGSVSGNFFRARPASLSPTRPTDRHRRLPPAPPLHRNRQPNRSTKFRVV